MMETQGLQRPRLLERLDAGWEYPLTLVCAPAGYGKTTLLRQWQRRSGQRVAWLTLEEVDGHQQRFLARLARALGMAPEGAGGGLAGLLNAVARRPAPLALVLDDYHRVEDSAPAQALAQVIGFLPPALRLLIASRHEPPLPLPRLRVRGELLELRAADLALAPEEAAAWGLPLTPRELAALVEGTEGWAMGMALGAPDLDRGYPAIAHYLEREVWAPQPAPLQRFLLAAGRLERLSLPGCRALTGGSDGQALLLEAERRNLFLFPMGGERREYRWHPLFRRFLSGLRPRAKQTR